MSGRLPGRLPARRKTELALLLLAGLAVIGFYASARLAGPAPWSYDEYYHLGVARELTAHFPLRTFPWTPFSILSEHFADKEPLFHLLLLPFARLPLETAGLAGVLAGQLFLVAAFSWVLWRLRVPHAYAFVLALTLLGSMFAMRVDMCRPHLLLMAFSMLVVGLLVSWPETRPGAPSPHPAAPNPASPHFAAPNPASPHLAAPNPASSHLAALGAARPTRGSLAALAGISALFSLAHSGAWIALFYAAVWGLAGFFTAKSTSAPSPGAAARRPFLWQPLAAAAAGWLLGQLVHPNLPYNLRLLWLQNVVVPFEASPAGNAALRSQIGEELTPPSLAILAEQWTVFLAPLAAAVLLWRRPRLRTRSTLAAAFIALAFLLGGSIFLRRLLELAAPLGLLALATVFAEAARQRRSWEGAEPAAPRPRQGLDAARDSRDPATARDHRHPSAAHDPRDPATARDRRLAPAVPARRDRRARRAGRDRAASAGDPSRPLLAGWGPWIVPFVLALGALWTAATVRAYGFGKLSAPRQMAAWLGEHGQPGERVFTAQWADSAPLFYSAPRLQSLVALDPTLFYARDPARFQEYVDITLGRGADPAAAIRRRFGARWVTLWRMPDYERLARQLLTPPVPPPATPGRPPAPPPRPPAELAYQDPYYLVLDLGRR
jgi:hypothetical protein